MKIVPYEEKYRNALRQICLTTASAHPREKHKCRYLLSMYCDPYGGKIVEDKPEERFRLDRYSGYDERVWGNEIITILCGARRYSGIDIKPFIEQVRKKKEWLQKAHPREFGVDVWDCDVDLLFIERQGCPECKKPQRIVRASDTEDGGCDVVAHCPWCLQDWQWHCDKHGQPSELQRYFHG